MNFLYPGFFWALLLLAIPVIIHLFNFRRYKKVIFPYTSFLKEVVNQSKSASVIKHLIILALRCLAFFFLVSAFTQPFIPLSSHFTNNALTSTFFIDNTFSTSTEGSKGQILQEEKNKAWLFASEFTHNQHFQLLSSNSDNAISLDKESFRKNLQEINFSPSPLSLNSAFTRFTENNSAKKSIFIFSDFQKNNTQIEKIPRDSNYQFFLFHFPSVVQENISIDSAWVATPFIEPGVPFKIKCRLKNYGKTNADNISIKIYLNNTQKAVSNLSLKSGEEGLTESEVTVFEGGLYGCKASIKNTPVTYDDDFYFSFSILPKINVTVINGDKANKYLDALFSSDKTFNYENVDSRQTNISALKSSQLVILNEVNDISTGLGSALTDYVSTGGVLFFIPSKSANPNINSFLSNFGLNLSFSKGSSTVKVTSVDFKNSLFVNVFDKVPQNLDLPTVTSPYAFSFAPKTPVESIIKLSDDRAFLISSRLKKGKLFAINAPLDIAFTSFPEHPLFVPVFFKTALIAASALNAPLTIGKNENTQLKNSQNLTEGKVHLINQEHSIDIIPNFKTTPISQEIYFGNQINQSGNYFLSDGSRQLDILSFNYDRSESDLSQFSLAELKQKITEQNLKNVFLIDPQNKHISTIIKDINNGIPLWRWCLLLVLLFLAMEILVYKILR